MQDYLRDYIYTDLADLGDTRLRHAHEGALSAAKDTAREFLARPDALQAEFLSADLGVVQDLEDEVNRRDHEGCR